MVWLATVAPLFACRTPRAMVADFEAEYVYQEDRYERLCVQTTIGSEAGCHKMHDLLHELSTTDPATRVKVGQIPVANKVQKIGALPKQEAQELERLFDQLRKLP